MIRVSEPVPGAADIARLDAVTAAVGPLGEVQLAVAELVAAPGVAGELVAVWLAANEPAAACLPGRQVATGRLRPELR